MHFSTTKEVYSKRKKKGGKSTAKLGETSNALKSRKSKEKLPAEPTASAFSRDPGEDALSDEQRVILDMVVSQGKSVFFTGPAGTGKSVLLRKMVSDLAKKYSKDMDHVAVTASTGMAAFRLDGTTLHRFAGIGLGQAPLAKLIQDINKCPYKRGRWLKAKVLVIDEISMVSAELFDKLDQIARKVRYSSRPFGGIQLVVTGDFFQLPPIVKGADDGSPRFCFQAESWKRAVPHTMNLTTIYRQKDPKLTKMLNEIREGEPSGDTIRTIQKLNRPLQWGQPRVADATELYPTRRGADEANARRMASLKGPSRTYHAVEGGKIKDPIARKRLLTDCIAPDTVELKVGAQVVLVKNMEDLVNGSQGLVVGFADDDSFRNSQWFGQDGNEPIKFEKDALPEPTSCLEKSANLYPVVCFSLPNGTTDTILCKPAEWTVSRWDLVTTFPEPEWRTETLATRVQVPLILGWALSIHKAQGQTLDRVKVDLGQTFENGQAYVALSRVTTIEGLQVLNFDPSKVTVHPAVKQFYSELSRAPTEPLQRLEN